MATPFRFPFNKLIGTVCLILILLATQQPAAAQAQDAPVDRPVYIVQAEDTLNTIALRFGITLDELVQANNIDNPNVLYAGQELLIPGLEGISGVLTTQLIPYGENLISLSRQSQVPQAILVRLNHLTSPKELFAGTNLVIPKSEAQQPLAGMITMKPGQSLLEAAVLAKANPWTLKQQNYLAGNWGVIVGDHLYYAQPEVEPASGRIADAVKSIQIDPLPLVQGATIEITVETSQPLTLKGWLDDRPLNFNMTEDNTYVAIQGVHAMVDPGLHPMGLSVTLTDGSIYDYEQMVLIRRGYFLKSIPLYVPAETMDPAVTKPEDDLVKATVMPTTPEKMWDGVMLGPVDGTDCINSRFGERRSYNESDYIYYHTGVDFYTCVNNLNIYAPAPGIVVLAGPLTVRGNATIIDHGWGIYTGYWHQAELYVKVGDRVEPGQIIGKIGGTGRAAGPHLHWELWANGVQVDPLVWLETVYP